MFLSNFPIAISALSCSIVLLLCDMGNALRFAPTPITVEPYDVTLNQPVHLTCNYIKYRKENVNGITWYVTSEGYRHKVPNASTRNGAQK